MSVGHLNCVGSSTAEQRPYRGAGAGPRRLAGYLPSCTAVDLSWDRKEKAAAVAQWLQPAQQTNVPDRVQVGNGGRAAARHEQHIKHILKKETGWGRQEQLFTGLPLTPSSAHRMRPQAAWACVLFPAAASSPDQEKQFVLRIIFLPLLPGSAVFLHHTFRGQSQMGPSVHHCYRRATRWWPWNLWQDRFPQPLQAVEPADGVSSEARVGVWVVGSLLLNPQQSRQTGPASFSL